MKDAIVFHINQISKPLLSPAVMEIATFYGTGEAFMHGLEEFRKAVEMLKEVPRGYLGWMDWGSSLEMIRKGGNGEEGEGEKGRAVVLMLGWRSMEDHMVREFLRQIFVMNLGESWCANDWLFCDM